MASVVHDPNGRTRISYRVGEKRYTLRLGKVSQDLAEDAAGKIARLVACRGAPHLIAPAVITWIRSLSDKHYDQLVAAGLLPPRPADPHLQQLIDAWPSLSTADRSRLLEIARGAVGDDATHLSRNSI